MANDLSTKDLIAELNVLVRELSYEKREITLVSGRKSDFYIDMKNTLLHPRGIFLLSHLIVERLKRYPGIKGVGGLTMGADPLSTGVCLASHGTNRPLFSFYIRKEPKAHGTQQWLEGMKNFKAGDSVVILEDVVTTGGSTLKSVERATLAGLKVEGVVTAVDREEGGRENILKAGVWFDSILTKSMIVGAK